MPNESTDCQRQDDRTSCNHAHLLPPRTARTIGALPRRPSSRPENSDKSGQPSKIRLLEGFAARAALLGPWPERRNRLRESASCCDRCHQPGDQTVRDDGGDCLAPEGEGNSANDAHTDHPIEGTICNPEKSILEHGQREFLSSCDYPPRQDLFHDDDEQFGRSLTVTLPFACISAAFILSASGTSVYSASSLFSL